MAKKMICALLALLVLTCMPAAMAETDDTDISARDMVLNRYTETLGCLAEDSSFYMLVDSSGNPLTDAVYTSIYASGSYPFFEVSVQSEDGVHDEGLLDGEGNVIIPAEYADIVIISDRWQAGVRLVPSEADDKDYTFSNWSTGEKLFFRIDSVDFYFDGHLAGTLDRSQYGDSYCSAHGAYICVKNMERKNVFYNSRMEPSPYPASYSSEYDTVYKNGNTTIYHQGTGQAAFTDACTLTPDEVENPYWYDRGVLYGLQGNTVFTPDQNYDSIYAFSGGYARVSMNRYYGVIDESGREVVPVVYDGIGYNTGSLKYGYISAEKDGKFGFVDLQGNVTCDFVYSTDIVNDKGTFATVKNLDGTIIVLSAAAGELPEHYADTYFAGSDGSLAFVAKNTKGETGLVDLYGNTVIPFRDDYRSIEVNREGTLALISFGSHQYRICRLSIEQPVPGSAPSAKDPSDPEVWVCSECRTENTGKFCTECGAKKPEESGSWICPECRTENTGNFCMECGAKRPE